MSAPKFLVVAGANGSGKSTSAPAVLPASVPYINADEIALAIARDHGVTSDLSAGRLMIEECERMESLRIDFAVETTLSNRSLKRRIMRLRDSGYTFHLLYFWLPSADLAISRVAERVRRGGHNIAAEVIRRRYTAGLMNFLHVYKPLAHAWRVYDNSTLGETSLVATGHAGQVSTMYNAEVWEQMMKEGDLDGPR